MIYLLDSNVFMHLTNGAKGAEKIEARIVAIGIASCIINPVIAAELRHKVEAASRKMRFSCCRKCWRRRAAGGRRIPDVSQ